MFVCGGEPNALNEDEQKAVCKRVVMLRHGQHWLGACEQSLSAAFHPHALPHALSPFPLSTTTTITQNKKVTEFLKTILGRPVVVKLNSGVDYRGTLG